MFQHVCYVAGVMSQHVTFQLFLFLHWLGLVCLHLVLYIWVLAIASRRPLIGVCKFDLFFCFLLIIQPVNPWATTQTR